MQPKYNRKTGEIRLGDRQIGFIEKRLDRWRATSVAGGCHVDLGSVKFAFESSDDAIAALVAEWEKVQAHLAARVSTQATISDLARIGRA